MIDSYLRHSYQKYIISPLLKNNYIRKIFPNFITLLALCFGFVCFFCLFFHKKSFAIIALFISGFLDTLDGSLARYLNKIHPKGAVFDIFSDRVVEACVILGLFFFDTDTRALPALLMLISSYLCVTSFLVVGIFTQNTSNKSFHYSPGLVERAEAFIFFSLMIAFPFLFIPLSYLYSFLVFLTALFRIYEFKRHFDL